MRASHWRSATLLVVGELACSHDVGGAGSQSTDTTASMTASETSSSAASSSSSDSTFNASATSVDSESSTGAPAVCGNGIVEAGEQCDGAEIAGLPCPAACAFAPGEELWMTRVGEVGIPEFDGGIAVDDDGVVFVGGFWFDENAVFSARVSRLEPDGTWTWSRSSSSDDPGQGHTYLAVAVDAAADRVIAVGEVGDVCAVALWTRAGEMEWAVTHDPGGEGAKYQAESVIVMPDDRILVACAQQDPVGVNPLRLLEYDVTGELLSSTVIDDPTPSPSNIIAGTQLARSSDGERFAFGCGTLAAAPFDAWLRVYRSPSEPLWDHIADGPAAADVDFYAQVAFAPDNSVVAVGTFHDESSDIWVHAFEADGAPKWTALYSDPVFEDVGGGVAIGADGSVFAHGYTRVDTAGDVDHWLRKYDPAGAVLWTQTWGDPDSSFSWDYGRELAIDPDGFVLTLGTAYTPDGEQDVIVRKIAP